MNTDMTNNLPIETVSSLESTDALDMYLAELRKTPLLSKEEELELFHKLNESDDLDAARKLVMAHLRFVVHVAKTYKGYGLPLLDIIQEGNVGFFGTDAVVNTGGGSGGGHCEGPSPNYETGVSGI